MHRRAWHTALQEVPVAMEFRKPLSDYQLQRLCETSVHIASISFSEQERRSLTLITCPEFRQRQAPYLRKLWNIELDGEGHASASALTPFDLSTLYASPLNRGKGTFSSSSIAHMSRLKLLSLRAYSYLDLSEVPSSVATLQVGPARLLSRLTHRVDRVIVNGGKAMYLLDDLTPYFTCARNIQGYATKLAAHTLDLSRQGDSSVSHRGQTDNPTLKCVVEHLMLEYDHLMVLDPLASSSWICRDASRGTALLKEHLGNREFITTEGRGRLHAKCIKMNAVRKKAVRFAEDHMLATVLSRSEFDS
ncbi:hypothetical protein WJX73_009542 [Symbiochloris irregularis]|uniref:Uncharacterized protein n=1 Tax=Symbiochloris irregularis TaxID=706552 RepID=A0AAW1PW59_9CHLO